MPRIAGAVLAVIGLRVALVAAATNGGSCTAQRECSSGATCSRSAAGASFCEWSFNDTCALEPGLSCFLGVSTAAPSGASCGAFQTACQTGSGQSCIAGTCESRRCCFYKIGLILLPRSILYYRRRWFLRLQWRMSTQSNLLGRLHL